MKRLFERDDLAADGGLGQEKVLRRERDTHAPAAGDEAADKVQRRQSNGKLSHALSSCDAL